MFALVLSILMILTVPIHEGIHYVSVQLDKNREFTRYEVFNPELLFNKCALGRVGWVNKEGYERNPVHRILEEMLCYLVQCFISITIAIKVLSFKQKDNGSMALKNSV